MKTLKRINTVFLVFTGLICLYSTVFSQTLSSKEKVIIERISNYLDNSDYKQSEFLTDSLILANLKKGNTNLLANAYNFKSILLKENRSMKEAIYYQNLALQLFKQSNLEKEMANCYVNLGSFYSDLEESRIALSYYFKALPIYYKINKKSSLIIVLNNIGNIYKSKNDIPSSNHYYAKALDLLKNSNDSMNLARVYYNMGGNYAIEKKQDSAINCFNKSLQYLQGFNEGLGHVLNYSDMARVYLYKEDVNKAEMYALKAQGIANENGIEIGKETLLSILSDIYKRKGNFVKAYHYLHEYHLYKDSLNKENIKAEVLKIEFDNELKQQRILQEQEKKNQDIVNNAKLEAKNKNLFISYTALGLVMILVVFIFRQYRQKQKINEIITEQKKLVEDKNGEILSSINYAKRIQYTLLAHDDLLKNHLKEHFVLFKPKDIVSGDFYWATHVPAVYNSDKTLKRPSMFYLAVCDSTGHGVPGAFMSLLSIGFIAEAINEKQLFEPHLIFNYVRNRLTESVSKDGQKDGFDGILVCFEINDQESGYRRITYAAANNAPVLVSGNQMLHLPYDKMPVGVGEYNRSFQLNEINSYKDASLYLYTDGFADQFGGPKGKKFKYKQLDELLLAGNHLKTEEQKQKLNETFDHWKGELEQVDDVCMIGIKL